MGDSQYLYSYFGNELVVKTVPDCRIFLWIYFVQICVHTQAHLFSVPMLDITNYLW